MAARDLHVELSGIRFAYPGQKLDVLRLDRLEIEAGARIALVGASGAGKTTLLRLLDGRLRGWRGEAKVLGRVLSPRWRPPPAERADVGFVFQDFALIDRLTVFENVRVGRLGRTGTLGSLAGRFTDADIEAVERAIIDVGLEAFADQRADRLSGGQRQRVGVARCLAQEPRIVIADEPVSNLDPAGAEAILLLLATTTESRGATLIVSSHQPKLVRDYVGRIIGLKGGRIQMDRAADALVPEDLAALYGWQIAPPAA